MVNVPPERQFWKDFLAYAAQNGVPAYVKYDTSGPPSMVWPRFYINEIENPQKRARIAWSGNEHVALIMINVTVDDFSQVVQPILEDGIHMGKPRKSWQSVNIKVPRVNVQKPAVEQSEELNKVFEAARRLRDFFIKHKQALLGIPITG